jgi:hypothetical protein
MRKARHLCVPPERRLAGMEPSRELNVLSGFQSSNRDFLLLNHPDEVLFGKYPILNGQRTLR